MVLRTVRRGDKSVEHLMELYAQLQRVPNFLEERNPLGVFLAPSTEILEVDDVGALVAVDIVPGRSAHAHMTFWDRRLCGREPLVRTAAELVMQAYDLAFVWTAIPVSNKQVLSFAERVGFLRFHEDGERVGLKLERSE